MSGGMEAGAARNRGAEHYRTKAIQPVDVARAWELPYALGLAVKYLCRYREKGMPEEDLRKAIHCIELELDALQDNPEALHCPPARKCGVCGQRLTTTSGGQLRCPRCECTVVVQYGKDKMTNPVPLDRAIPFNITPRTPA